MTTSIDALRIRNVAAEHNAIDLAWERSQEQALQAFRTADSKAAWMGWARGLDIAERHFERGDPRLAASRSNQAFALLREQQVHPANALFKQAITAWEESWRWVPLMTPSTKYGDALPYDRETQESFYALIKQGQEMTETIWHENRLPAGCTDDWSEVKPAAMTDIRRLYAAILLMATARSCSAGGHAA